MFLKKYDKKNILKITNSQINTQTFKHTIEMSHNETVVKAFRKSYIQLYESLKTFLTDGQRRFKNHLSNCSQIAKSSKYYNIEKLSSWSRKIVPKSMTVCILISILFLVVSYLSITRTYSFRLISSSDKGSGLQEAENSKIIFDGVRYDNITGQAQTVQRLVEHQRYSKKIYVIGQKRASTKPQKSTQWGKPSRISNSKMLHVDDPRRTDKMPQRKTKRVTYSYDGRKTYVSHEKPVNNSNRFVFVFRKTERRRKTVHKKLTHDFREIRTKNNDAEKPWEKFSRKTADEFRTTSTTFKSKYSTKHRLSKQKKASLSTNDPSEFNFRGTKLPGYANNSVSGRPSKRKHIFSKKKFESSNEREREKVVDGELEIQTSVSISNIGNGRRHRKFENLEQNYSRSSRYLVRLHESKTVFNNSFRHNNSRSKSVSKAVGRDPKFQRNLSRLQRFPSRTFKKRRHTSQPFNLVNQSIITKNEKVKKTNFVRKQRFREKIQSRHYERKMEVNSKVLELNQSDNINVSKKENHSSSEIFANFDKNDREDKILIYNRIPKCGSSSLTKIIRKLAKTNNFTHHTSKNFDQWRLSSVEKERFVLRISNLKKPSSFDRHVFFVDFKRQVFEIYIIIITFRRKQPIYINMLRDPVERFVSSYYYAVQQIKNSSGFLKHNQKIPEWINMSLWYSKEFQMKFNR
ncbi:Uronyl 2-sulfotransferase [Nymphon striatum]|nr:Uronyl 2-sulfotransferase [Nymphon striatum]